jgi:putative transposase
MCKVLNVSRSGYYAWLEGKPSKRALENEQLTEQISLIHTESRHTYGSPRISEALKAIEITVSRPRVDV